MLNFSTFLMSR